MSVCKSVCGFLTAAALLLAAQISSRASTAFAVTQPATRLSRDASVLNAMVVPNGQPTVAWFELGVRGQYELRTPATDLEDGSTVVAISAVVSNLLPNTTYQTRLVASNAAGITYGAPVLFASASSVLAWGDNWFSQTAIPAGLDDAVAIAAGEHHTLILRANGKVVGLGYNSHGQATIPRRLTDIIAIAAGENHSVALKADGRIVAWGSKTYGQTNVPAGLRDVISIAAGNNHTLALRLDGSVVAWGLNDSGQTDVPLGLSNVVAIAAGASHSVALKADGSVTAWGNNSFGQTRVPTNFSAIVAIAAGGDHTLGVRNDGRVVAWGLNASGQMNIPADLFNGQPPARTQEEKVGAEETKIRAISIAAGARHSLVLRPGGSVAVSGFNGEGEASVPEGLGDVVAIAGGGAHSVVLANNISEKTRASAIMGSNRDALYNLSLAHAGSDPLTLLSGKFSHRLALYPTQKPPQPVSQQLTIPANEDLVVTLTASTSDSAPAFRIASLPPGAKLYQYTYGNRGAEIIADSPVTDPAHRIIFVPDVNAFGTPFSSFNFVASDSTNVSANSPPAIVSISVLPPEPPHILAIEQLSSGAVQLLIQAQPNTAWAISASPDFANWKNLGFATPLGSGVFVFTDPEVPGFPTRFYRVGLR